MNLINGISESSGFTQKHCVRVYLNDNCALCACEQIKGPLGEAVIMLLQLFLICKFV